MAIQSFSVGQVLTAAQVNALQANDYNQTVSNKTASYTLVAADKGTRIAMSSTSATTITVNSSLFSAGDTLFIQNLNTGVSTITAGTATVTTSASLALAQWEGGTLYFTSASAAIFIKGAGAAASGGGLTLINTGGTTLTGTSVTISSIPGTYKNLFIVVDKAYVADDTGGISVYARFNSDTGSNYTYQTINSINNVITGRGDPTQTNIEISARITDQNTDIKKTFGEMTVRNYTNTDGVGFSSAFNSFNSSEHPGSHFGTGSYDGAAAITSVTILTAGSTFSGGTVYVYGES